MTSREQILERLVEKQKELLNQYKYMLNALGYHALDGAKSLLLASEIAELEKELERENITKDELGYYDTEISEKANNKTE